MCGIVGIAAGGENVIAKAVAALRQLEYRGYDSSGIAFISGGKFEVVKAVGKIDALEKKLVGRDLTSNIAIAHTRWATHGGATEENAHPHLSSDGKVSVVHNGIIENYESLKTMLVAEGFSFASQTDTEVIANLAAYHLRQGKEVLAAFQDTISALVGSFAIAMLVAGDSTKIYVAKNASPLLIGLGSGKNIVASSLSAIGEVSSNIITLQDGWNGVMTADSVQLFDKNRREVEAVAEEIAIDDLSSTKGAFPHFMLKEIYEQPAVMRKIIAEYLDGGRVALPPMPFDLASVSDLTIVACGTAYNAALASRYLFENIAGVNVNVDCSSEFRYRETPLRTGGAAIFVSQSGETADTIAALKYCKENGQKIIGVVNVAQSTIASLSDVVIKTLAGPEVAVASTKAFTAQISALYLFALAIASAKGVDVLHYVEAVRKAPSFMEFALEDARVESVREAAELAAESNYMIAIGRDALYPLALETALKITEVSYIPTIGFASGELKHGPISLIAPKMCVIALNNSQLLFDKNASSIEEVAARNGRVIMVGDRATRERLADKISCFIEASDVGTDKFLMLMSLAISVQLLSYYISDRRGIDVDKPRNLAKSVTVE